MRPPNQPAGHGSHADHQGRRPSAESRTRARRIPERGRTGHRSTANPSQKQGNLTIDQRPRTPKTIGTGCPEFPRPEALGAPADHKQEICPSGAPKGLSVTPARILVCRRTSPTCCLSPSTPTTLVPAASASPSTTAANARSPPPTTAPAFDRTRSKSLLNATPRRNPRRSTTSSTSPRSASEARPSRTSPPPHGSPAWRKRPTTTTPYDMWSNSASPNGQYNAAPPSLPRSKPRTCSRRQTTAWLPPPPFTRQCEP